MPVTVDVIGQSAIAAAPTILAQVFANDPTVDDPEVKANFVTLGDDPAAIATRFRGAIAPLPALRSAATGLGAIALSSLLKGSLSAEAPLPTSPANPLAPRAPHFAARAKQVIYLHLTGSPPHLDLYDYKPELVKRNGQDCPDAFLKGKRFAFTSGVPKLLGTPRTFAQHGKGGVWLSDAIPHLHSVADELCVIRSMTTGIHSHSTSGCFMLTGHEPTSIAESVPPGPQDWPSMAAAIAVTARPVRSDSSVRYSCVGSSTRM